MPRVWAVERGIITAFLLAAALLFAAALARGGGAAAPAGAPAVSALAHAMPDQGWAPLTAYFSSFGSRSEHAGPLRYEWDLDGNGSFEIDASADGGYASSTYAKPGQYRVSLRVTDTAGHSAVSSTTVLVRHPASSDVDYWTVFDDSRVGRVDLLVSQAAWNRMWEDPKTEVEAGAIVLGTPVERIGLSMKGNASLDASGDKKPWKIDVNAYVERQDYENLPMVLLHNNFADPSMLREALAYEMLRFAGANAGFTRFVEVWIDITDDGAPGRYWGVYTMVERPDRRFITNRFGRGSNDGNLYKADAWFEEGAADLAYYGEDIGAYPMPRGRIAYRKMTNVEEADYSDIIELTRVIDGIEYATPDDFAAALEEVLDVDSYLRYLAATFLHLNLDTYPYTGNNYYLYADPTAGVFRWIAWDENNSWGNFGGDARFPLFGSEQSLGPLEYAPLFVKTFEVDRYRTTYAAYVDLLIRHWFNEPAIAARAQHLHDLLAPFVTASTGDPMYVGSTAMFEPADFDAGWRAVVGLTAERSAFIASELQAFRSGGDP